MAVEKRKPRSYKIADVPYNKALKQGYKKGKIPLATLLEQVATYYGKGYSVSVFDVHGNRQEIVS